MCDRSSLGGTRQTLPVFASGRSRSLCKDTAHARFEGGKERASTRLQPDDAAHSAGEVWPEPLDHEAGDEVA